MEEENRKKIVIKLILTFILLIIINFFLKQSLNNNLLQFLLYFALYIYIGNDVLYSAFISIKKNKSINECVLMSIATVGAFCMAEYNEAIFVMLFYQLGEFFEDFTVDKTKESLSTVMNLKPEKANLFNDKNEVVEVDPKTINIGDIIVVKPYEKIPLDGEVIDGETYVNTSMLTGESIPRLVKVGSTITSGIINGENLIKIKVSKRYDDSTVVKLINLIENAYDKKSSSEKFITKFAKLYTPIVCIIAVLVCLLPPILNIIIGNDPLWNIWLYRALTLLVISCPCAILVSVPLAFFSSIASASKNGVLIKGSNLIEYISKIKHIAFDKTGTMTKGVFEVIGIHHSLIEEDLLIDIVAHAEFYSNHPIAKSIIRYYGKTIDKSRIKNVVEVSGHGISAEIDGKNVLVGNSKLMKDNNIDYIECNSVGTIVHVAIDNKYEGHILIADIIKENAKDEITDLKKLGIDDIMMLTGDSKKIGEYVANEIGINKVYSEILPEDKLNHIEEMLNRKLNNECVAYVGDGINDAPCITRADIGFAMGGLGSDQAIDVADIVIMNDNPINISKTIATSKKTIKIVYENIVGSILIKVLILILAIAGISNMWMATFADVGVLILAILNSIRAMYIYK